MPRPSTATDHVQTTRERVRASPISKEDVPDGLRIIREFLEVQGILRGLETSFYHYGDMNYETVLIFLFQVAYILW